MSSSPIIPKEKLSAYQRWELGSFNERRAHPRGAPATSETEPPAHVPGYDQGRADGLREGMLKAAADAQQLRALMTSVSKQGEEVNQQLAEELLELALEIARRMVHEALDVHRGSIIPVVQDAIAQLARPLAQPVLTLHPQDAAIVREHLGEQLAVDGWRIVDDPTMARGGCKLQTLSSQADATAGVRWQHITAALGKSTPWVSS